MQVPTIPFTPVLPPRLGARLIRLTQEHQRAARQLGPSGHRASRDLELEEALEELQARVRELEHRNEGLRGRLLAYKQQLQLGAYKHHGLYGHIPARVDTGLRRAHTASGRGPERQRKGKGPANGCCTLRSCCGVGENHDLVSVRKGLGAGGRGRP